MAKVEWKVERVTLEQLESVLNTLTTQGWTVFAVLGPDGGGGHPVIANRSVK